MTYGLQVQNASGNVQIDENYRNLLKIGSGVTSATFTDIMFPTSQYPHVPMVFARPAADGIYVGGADVQHDRFRVVDATGAFEWVAFGLAGPQMVENSNYGLQVFDASGNVTYDSRYEAVRVQTILNVTQPWPDFYSGGSQYADYPIYLNFAGWGKRPWVHLNPFIYIQDDLGTTFSFTTNGTGQIIIRDAGYVTGSQQTRSFPFGRADIALMRRYSD